MNRLLPTATLLAAAALAGLGCVPQKSRPAGWTNPLDSLAPTLPSDPNDPNYVLRRMEFGRIAILHGCPLRAEPRLVEAFEQLDTEHENVGAALSTERLKYYKGETYERAMLCVYLGMIEYLQGDYNRARIFLSRAVDYDRGAVVKDDTPPEVGRDFGLAYYWLGKTYARLGEQSNSEVAFRRATTPTPRQPDRLAREKSENRQRAAAWRNRRAEGEQWAWQTFHDAQKPALHVEDMVNLAAVEGASAGAPAALQNASETNPVRRAADSQEEFFTPVFQKGCNLVLSIEVGRCPYKYLTGINNERTEIGRPCILPHSLRVYVDGHYAGPAFKVLDLWDQSVTQDRIAEKDAAQTTKGILKEILSHAPYVGSVAGYWDVSGDMRHWTTLPGNVYLFAGRFDPGRHTVRVQAYDVDGNLLPRWTSTWYGLPAPAEDESCVLLQPCYDHDNRLSKELVRKAIAAGSKPGSALVMPGAF